MSIETIIHILTTLGALIVAGFGFVRHVDKTSAIQGVKLDNLGAALSEHKTETRDQIGVLVEKTDQLSYDVAELRGQTQIGRSSKSNPPHR